MTLLLLACAPPVVDTADELLELDSVEYRVDWDTSGVELSEQGWSVEGLTVTEAWLVHNSLSWVPCSYGVALGHVTDEDPSMLDSVVEDLSTPGPLSLGTLSFETEAYCQFFLLDARLTDHPEEPMADLTLVLEGTVGAGRLARPFRVESDASMGEILGLDELEIEGEGPHAVVTVHRSLEGLLAGVDVEDSEAGEALLDNLYADQWVSLELSP